MVMDSVIGFGGFGHLRAAATLFSEPFPPIGLQVLTLKNTATAFTP